MTTQPAWSEVDEETGSLLDLIADDGSLPHEAEWETYQQALRDAADNTGHVSANALRRLVRGQVKPNRLGAFARRAVLEGITRADGYEVSDDREGGNAGRPARCYRLVNSP